MEFSEVHLSYSLFTNTNEIANKNKITLFLTTQLRTKIKLSLNVRLRIMEYTTPLPQLKSVTEAFRYKEYSCVYWDRSLAEVLTPASVQYQLAGRTFYKRLEEHADFRIRETLICYWQPSVKCSYFYYGVRG
jgi:hypothetical protein